MSPPTMNPSAHTSNYTSTPTDVVDRHDYGVQKNRKPASTGGGRAWSEDEEVYLLQTRLQKMPYKHIAAHLKKTELACRLHYHQLSHGSNRRKRTSSTSSGSSTSVHSPVLGHAVTSPIQEHNYPFSPEQTQIHLPPTSTLLPRSASSSPQRSLGHPIAILPKPSPPRHISGSTTTTPPLRLDCALPSMSAITTTHSRSPVSYSNAPSINHARLASLYDAHRAVFWGSLACEYGPSASASQLEDAYFRMRTSNPSVSSNNGPFAPPTPCISPDGHSSSQSGTYLREKEANTGNGKTSISALLGIDASPRSPKERELIRQIEEGRVGA